MFLSDVLPASIAWNPADDDLVLLGTELQDLPIAEAVLATLPRKARGQLFVEAASEADVRGIAAPGRVGVTWLLRDRGQSLRCAVDAWLAEMLPVEAEREHRVYAWISGDVAAHALVS
jgi:NADPH-dependent ferric siderophore reductase